MIKQQHVGKMSFLASFIHPHYHRWKIQKFQQQQTGWLVGLVWFLGQQTANCGNTTCVTVHMLSKNVIHGKKEMVYLSLGIPTQSWSSGFHIQRATLVSELDISVPYDNARLFHFCNYSMLLFLLPNFLSSLKLLLLVFLLSHSF